MKKLLLITFLNIFGIAFSQENSRNHNLIVAFDSSLKIDTDNPKRDLTTQIEGFSTILETNPFNLKYSFCFTEEKLQEMEEQALKISGSAVSIQNLRNVFDVVNPNLTDDELQNLSKKLQQLPHIKYVELVDTKPIKPPFDIPPTTPNYTSQQNYIGNNPGVNMQYAWDMNLNGQGIRIRNIEYGFNKNHEEFHQNPAIFLAPGYTIHPDMTADWTEHGTGTFGVVFADNGTYGVTGLAYGAEEVILYPEYTVEYGYNRAYTVSLALNNSQQGDVVIYEMQTGGANSTEASPNYVPAEYTLTIWNLTKAASDLGVIVVAAAGNGDQDLDLPAYADYMNRGNSGAIIVGAGKPDFLHNRLFYAGWWGSTYGSRVNLQGWGENVLSTGYGDFSTIGGDFNQQYTMFSGTSSATPIVASCVAVLQSYYHSLTNEYLTSSELIEILQITGFQQGSGVPGNVGPLPNMQAAVAYVETLSSKTFEGKPSFNIYPNPFENTINIVGFNNFGSTKAELYNALGQKIMENTFDGQTTISAGNLKTGVYFLRLTQNGKTTTHKVIKK